jgi:5'-deoxynucleotidase
MRNTKNENICEHSLEVAFIAHALGIINNEIFHGKIDAPRLAILGMYHDVTEIITGDMPTPVKYYSSVIRNAYKDVENVAKEEILTGLPDAMKYRYADVLTETNEEEELWKYVKAADKISALIKCIEERKMGNSDFADAEKTIASAIEKMQLPEVDYFMKEFLPAYMTTLDESSSADKD